MSAVAETLQIAVREHQSGRLAQAEQMYRRILRADPQHADALHLLGVLAHQTGRHQDAVVFIRRAIASNPRVAAFHLNLGAVYYALGKLDEAVASCRRALRIDPASAESHNNLGNALKALGKLDEAISSYRRALEINPNYANAHYNAANALASQCRFDEAAAGFARALQINPSFAEAHYNLGLALENQGRFREAAIRYRSALQIRPDYVEAANNLGGLLEQEDQLDEAADSYRRALGAQPDCAEAHNNLGTVFQRRGQLEEAAACYRRAVSLKPDYPDAHSNLGLVLNRQGKLGEASASFRRALDLRPGRALWELRIATLCPAVFASNEAIDQYRSRLLADLQAFAARDLAIDPRELSTSGAEPPLNLMYHGRNDRPIKEAHARIFRRCIPENKPPVRSGTPRIGFVVTGDHESVFLWFMRGALESWNTELFDVFVVCSRAGAAKIRSAVQNPAIQILAFAGRFDRIVDAIREARFDLLYYWEVGTDPVNYFLPFFRLAPVQCTSGGVPATSGIPAMDYYLSNELWETEDSENRYTETLVRTKTNLVCPLRVTLPGVSKTRESFGFAAGRRLYLCAQKIEKFHPDFDGILAGVLRRDESGVVIVVEDQHRHAASALRSRFAAAIPDVADRIVFLPRQPYADYLALVASSDVLLDTLHYCGGSTTYQGLSLGKPIVTLPSQMQAGRSTYAFYRKMGVLDCVASDPDEYAQIAVRLAADADRRANVSERIRAASSLLFEDLEAVRELERLFLQLIGNARAQ